MITDSRGSPAKAAAIQGSMTSAIEGGGPAAGREQACPEVEVVAPEEALTQL